MKNEKVLLNHGSGGKLMDELIRNVILKNLTNPILGRMQDSAVLKIGKTKAAFTTDSYIVNPIFFPGGNIGTLAVNGTVNDLSMMGAKPLYISLALIIEEGFPISSLKKIILSVKEEAKKAGVQIVCGDFKVGETNSIDKIFINTSGIGIIPEKADISTKNAKPGDVIILSGEIAEHGVTVMNERNGLNFKGDLKTDSQALNLMVEAMLKVSSGINAMRDPTRGGLASVLNEIAISSEVGIEINEEAIPIKKEVMSACDILGLDPFYVANEGKLVAIVTKKDAQKILKTMKKTKTGKKAAIIGNIVKTKRPQVILETKIGGKRILDMLSGEQLPRIC